MFPKKKKKRNECFQSIASVFKSICWPFVFCFSFNSPGNACQQPQQPNPGCELQMKVLHSSVSQGPACWYLLQMGTPGQASRASPPPTTSRMLCSLGRRHVAGWPVRYFPGHGSTSPGPSPKASDFRPLKQDILTPG